MHSLRYFRLLLEYPNGFTVPAPIELVIKPASAQTSLPTGCTVTTTINTKYDNKDDQIQNSSGETILTKQRSSVFDIGVDLSACTDWSGYSTQSIEVRDYDDLSIENKLRGAGKKGAGQCITAPIGCALIRSQELECFDLQSNKVTQRTEGGQKIYENEYNQCYIKDTVNKHPIEQDQNLVCVYTGHDCQFDIKCYYDPRVFKSQKCLQYKKIITYEYEHMQTSNQNPVQVTVNQQKVESKLNKKLGHAKLHKTGGNVNLFVEKFGDSIEQLGVKAITFHIALTKSINDDVIYIKKIVNFDMWLPTALPQIQMMKNGAQQTGTIFRDWGGSCDFKVQFKNQDPTSKLTAKAYVKKNQISEKKFDNGEENLNDLVGGSSLNQKQCFDMFGVAAKNSGGKMMIYAFNGIDRVIQQQFDVVLRAPKKTDIKSDCINIQGYLNVQKYIRNQSGNYKTPLQKTDQKYQIKLDKDTNVIINAHPDFGCSNKIDGFKIIVSYAEDLFKEQCLYNDPSCKQLGDCKILDKINCDSEGCTIQSERKKFMSIIEKDLDSNSIKRVNGQFDCYIEVSDSTPFNGKKTLPDDIPKYQIPFEDGPQLFETILKTKFHEFLNKFLGGDVTLYVHVFQSDNLVVDYYYKQPLKINFIRPGLQIYEVLGSNQYRHLKNKDLFLRPRCLNPENIEKEIATTMSLKYKCDNKIDQSFCDQSLNKNLIIPKSSLGNYGRKYFKIICEETYQNGLKIAVEQPAEVFVYDNPDCPKLRVFPESIEINDQKLKKFQFMNDLFKFKIIIDKRECPQDKLLDTMNYNGDQFLKQVSNKFPKPGSDDFQQFSYTFTRDEILSVKPDSKYHLSIILYTMTQIISVPFSIFRPAAQLIGLVNGGNTIGYKGDSFPFDIQIADTSLDTGIRERFLTQAFCPNWIPEDQCQKISFKNFKIGKELTNLIPIGQLQKPQKFEFKIHTTDGRETSILTSMTLLDSSIKSQNLSKFFVRRDGDKSSKYAKYGQIFFYATSINSQTGIEEDINLYAWNLSWDFLYSQTDQQVKNITKSISENIFIVDLKSKRKDGSKKYKAVLTLKRKSDDYSFKISNQIMTAPPFPQIMVQQYQNNVDQKDKRYSFTFEYYQNIEQFAIRCVQKGKEYDDLFAITKQFIQDDCSFVDLQLPNSDDNDCYSIAKDLNGNIQSQKIAYKLPREPYKNKDEALQSIDVNNMEELLNNPFFKEASIQDKGHMLKRLSKKLDSNFNSKKGADGLIPKSETRNSISTLKSFMKGLDVEKETANKAEIESRTLLLFELVMDSVVNAMDTLSDSDLQNAFEIILNMEEQMTFSQRTRSKAKVRRHEIISMKLKNSRQGQVQTIQTGQAKIMYTQVTPSILKRTMEFQASEKDPKVIIQPDVISKIGQDASLEKLNCLLTTSNIIPKEIQTNALENKLKLPFQQIQNIEITSQNGKELVVRNLEKGKEIMIEFPQITLQDSYECLGSFIDESTSKLSQTGVKCQYDINKKTATILTSHLTKFLITTQWVGEATTPTKTPTTTKNPTIKTPHLTYTDDSLSEGVVIIIAVAILLLIVGLVILIICIRKKIRRNSFIGRSIPVIPYEKTIDTEKKNSQK